MADNWAFVAAAYGLTAIVLGLYWRRLVRKERRLTAIGERTDQERRQRPHNPSSRAPQ